MTFWLNEEQVSLLIEALDMLQLDYEQGGNSHPDLEAIQVLEAKLHRRK